MIRSLAQARLCERPRAVRGKGTQGAGPCEAKRRPTVVVFRESRRTLVQFIKTICVITVLGALAYGAYNTLTSSPPSEPPHEAANWDSPPDVQLPGEPSAGSGSSLAGGGAAPKYSAGGSSTTARIAPGGPVSGASITNVRPVDAQSVPDRYPTTNVPPSPLDAVGATPIATSAGPSLGGASNVSPVSAVSAGGLSAVPQVVHAGPSTTSNHTAGGVSFPPATTPVAPVTTTAALTTTTTTAAAEPKALLPSMEKVQGFLNQGKFAEAHEELSHWFDHPQLSEEERYRVQTTLDQLAGRVIYSREHLLEPPHTVVQGETLQAVADRYQVPLELLVKINGIADPLYLPAGTQLKVIKGPFDALVDKSRRHLTLFVGDGLYAGSFPVGFGRDLTLPEGNYVVQAKLVNPTFQAADGMITADDPSNPLGERWLDLGNRQGIHGSIDPAALASPGSRGYLILNPRDSEDVYDILSLGSKVMIRQ
ncbi:MAG: hypothetical protein C0483_21345 [Pirellula sp.]|nr:hypothetical protein [Pirellula sp.]